MFFTIMSHSIITATPSDIPSITVCIFDISIASGIRLKHTIDSISPDANDSIKLINLFEFRFNIIPISPPIVVPTVPKNSPISDVCNIVTSFFVFAL